MNLCDEAAIRVLLSRHGFSFSKNLGQNFLRDQEIPAAIAEGAGLDEQTCAVEIGPGIGALTAQLCRRAKKVAAVELDRRLLPILEETMADFKNLVLIPGDVLKTDLPALCRQQFGDSPVVACANLPYYITTPAVTALLQAGCFRSVVVMVQKEAAQRICAKPGEDGYCAFSVQAAYYARPRVLLDVPRDRFLPQPKVDSVVLRLDQYLQPPVPGKKEELFQVIRAAFANRRKTFANGLCMQYGGLLTKSDAAILLESLGFAPDIRGERLSLEDFSAVSVKLHNFLREKDGLLAENHL